MTAEQEQLVVAHMPIVPAIARQLVKRLSLPHWIDIQEMISCGYVGLCNAALRFDPERGVQFGTFASFKVRASIIDDFLRKQEPVMVPMEGDDQMFARDVLNHDANSQFHPNIEGREPADPTTSIEDVLIEADEQRRKCRHIVFAEKSMDGIEYRAITKKLKGETLRQIGKAEGRSASWAHYRVHCGERQLREALLDPAAVDA